MTAKLAVIVLAMLAATLALPQAAEAASDARLMGTVVDGRESTPLRGMTVDVFPSSSSGSSDALPVASLTSGPDGRLAVALARGSSMVEVSDPAGFYGLWRSGICVADASSELIQARLFAGGTLRGLITDGASGGPIPRVCVTVYGPLPDRPSTLKAGCSSADGTYRSRALPPGSYLVYFSDPAGEWGNVFLGGGTTMEGATPVEITAGTDAAVADMALNPVAPGDTRARRTSNRADWLVSWTQTGTINLPRHGQGSHPDPARR